MSLFPVIMAGGSGTRFWPLSRRARPKQFLPLSGGAPMLVETFERVAPLCGADPLERTLVVCGQQHAETVRTLMPGLPARNLLLEPVARNTAPCIALAAVAALARDPEALLLVLPSDHHVADPAAMRAALAKGVEGATEGRLVTIGISPTRPETGFGYLLRGRELAPGSPPLCEVVRFVEKPDLERAKSYLASGDYLWNAGIFLFRADRILDEIERHLPDARAPLALLRQAAGTASFDTVLAEQFPKMPATSIDFGVMERAEHVALVPGAFGWSDVGSFPALPEVRSLDAAGNVVEGEVFQHGVSDSVLLAQGGRPVAVVGLSGVVVVDTGDALLVCSKERAQEVREVVALLERSGRGGLL